MSNSVLDQQTEDNGGITGKTHWWGFTLYLSENATKNLEGIDEIGEKIAKALGKTDPEFKTIANLIGKYLKLRNSIIKHEDKGEGVKLVSPWIIPTLLVPLPRTGRQDPQLRWSVFGSDESGNYKWSSEHEVPGAFSNAGGTLATFNKGLVYAAQGTEKNGQLWHMIYDQTQTDDNAGTWGPYQTIPNAFSADRPSIVEFEKKLHCLFKGSNDDKLWWTSYNGKEWQGHGEVPGGALITSGPALAVFRNKLYCVMRGKDSCHYWMTYQNGCWSGVEKIDGAFTGEAPALAVYRDHLYCVSKGSGKDTCLWWMSFDGNSWSRYTQIPACRSNYGPALSVLDDKLYCVHRGAGDNKLWYLKYIDGSWGIDYEVVDGGDGSGDVTHYAGHTPALAPYLAPNAESGTQPMLMCMYRGID